jgi:hypothetical protein
MKLELRKVKFRNIGKKRAYLLSPPNVGLKDPFLIKIFSSTVSRLCVGLRFKKQTKRGYFYADVDEAHPL